MIAHTMLESQKSGTWEYDKHSQFSKQSGSGNNWAYGYDTSLSLPPSSPLLHSPSSLLLPLLQNLICSIRYNVHGPSTLEPIMEIVQRQAEACDSLGGFFLMQSLAGGTGSGVGTPFSSSYPPFIPLSLFLFL